ncbi:LysR substrate-binding domain-containing protein [Enterococcus sp. AZ109]|uniref:LysR substrate-binding domain-containing protein n=1 Tax=Enterococcus sp. AZ109 TaxID=2774634 RepID=UPI003F22FDD9
MKIEYLQSFVTLSNTLNYTKAAESLYITQPTLSRHIQLLEAELGCTLVARNTRQVQLTEEGKVFLSYATNMIFDYNRATHQLKERNHELGYQLAISFLRGGTDAYLLPLLQAFTQAYPKVELQLQDGTHEELVTDLRAGKHDLCMTMATTLIGIEQIKMRSVSKLALVLVVPEGHPLAETTSVTFADFAKEPYLCVQKQQTKAWYDYVVSLFLSQGYYPRVNDSCSSVKTLLMQVALGKGISVLTEGCRSSTPDNIKLIPIQHVPAIQTVFGYREDNDNPSLKLFTSWLEDYLY